MFTNSPLKYLISPLKYFAKNKKKKRYNLTFVNKFMANIWLNLWIFCHPFVPVVEILVGTHIGHFSGEFVNV